MPTKRDVQVLGEKGAKALDRYLGRNGDIGKALGCYDCDREFASVEELTNHERKTGHGTCPKCGQWFAAHNDDGSCVED